jgi:hypothetical protein
MVLERPFEIEAAPTTGQPIIIVDAHEQVVAACVDERAARFVATLLNTATHLNPFVASMLSAFRLTWEAECGAPISVYDDLVLILDDLCSWFGLNTGERAIVLGPEALLYLEQAAPAAQLDPSCQIVNIA